MRMYTVKLSKGSYNSSIWKADSLFNTKFHVLFPFIKLVFNKMFTQHRSFLSNYRFLKKSCQTEHDCS